jgi:hypothetical protein
MSFFNSHIRNSRFGPLWVVALVALLGLSFAEIGFGQTGGTIRGSVIEEGTAGILPGANIVLEGTTLGAAADPDGNYTITNVPPGSYKIKGSFIGYKSQTKDVTVMANQEATVDFNLDIDALDTEAIVVTGVASSTSKAVAPIAIQRIDAKELTEVSNYTSVHELLGGKVAGVSLQKSQGRRT